MTCAFLIVRICLDGYTMKKSVFFFYMFQVLNCLKEVDFLTSCFAKQEEMRTLNFNEGINDKFQMKDNFYRSLNQPLQNVCQVVKSIGGVWTKQCGFLDGEKSVCFDLLYEAVKDDNCLVYSFGLGKDWTFETFMARQGICHLM